MKTKIILLLFLMTAINSLPAVAQATVEQFSQPYPAGEPLVNNPNFIGQAYLHPLTSVESLNTPMFNVTFEPGCRNSWHSHSGGQLLIATAGIGYYQERGKAARRLYPGDIVEIAPDVEHWHGAAPDRWFAHIAIECNPGANQVTWICPVNDADYLGAAQAATDACQSDNRSLDKRQQAIVAIAAFTGKGELGGLRGALKQGLSAGMTVNEIKEVLIHAYAYCGFPRSLRAIQTFMALLDERKATGIEDSVGRDASPVANTGDKFSRGRDILSALNGLPADAPANGFALFAPTIEKFLKEHLFCDIFEHDLLTYKERELATVSILAGVGGVEPMAYGHIGICLHLGLTPMQMQSLFDIVETNLGKASAEPMRKILDNLTKRQ